MTRFLPAPMIALTVVFSMACANENPSVPKAEESAKAWLALTDGGRYAESWDAAASAFKEAISRSNWEGAVSPVRTPLGAVLSRKVKSATFTRTLPGAPEGEYVVILFETRFENKPAAIETVTPMRDKDGTWKVSGYFIR